MHTFGWASRIVGVVGALALVGVMPTAASAAPGQLDPTFGHLANGTVLTDHGPGEFIDKVLRQPDGKIITVAGGIDVNSQSTIVVTRYLRERFPRRIVRERRGLHRADARRWFGHRRSLAARRQDRRRRVVGRPGGICDRDTARLLRHPSHRERQDRPGVRDRAPHDQLQRHEHRRSVRRRARSGGHDRGRRAVERGRRDRALHLDRRARPDVLR